MPVRLNERRGVGAAVANIFVDLNFKSFTSISVGGCLAANILPGLSRFVLVFVLLVMAGDTARLMAGVIVLFSVPGCCFCYNYKLIRIFCPEK